MSSTGRGARLGGPDDFYVTPAWTVDRLLDVWTPPGGVWLEPGAGNGAIIRAVNARRTDVKWRAVEIRDEELPALVATGAAVYIHDFLGDNADPSEDIAVVIGNPPFSLAMEFILRAREVAPSAEICFLLRTNFSGSEARAEFMRTNAPDLLSLPNRPSFVGGKTDSIEYSWFVWPAVPRAAGVFRVLGSTPASVRNGKAKP